MTSKRMSKEKSLIISAPENMMVPCETINLNSGASNPEGEVVEGVARVGLEVVADVWSGMEPSCGEAHPGDHQHLILHHCHHYH